MLFVYSALFLGISISWLIRQLLSWQTASRRPPQAPTTHWWLFWCPWVSHTWDLISDADFSKRLHIIQTMRSLFQQSTILGRSTVFHGPEALRFAFKADGTGVEATLPQHWQPLVGPQSITSLYGQEHRLMRKQLGRVFQAQALAAYLPFVQLRTHDFLKGLADRSSVSPVALYPPVKEYAMDIALRVILSQDMQTDERLKGMLVDFTEWQGGLAALVPVPIPGLALWRAHRARDRIIDVLRLFLKERSAEDHGDNEDPMDMTGKDMLSRLLAIEDEETGQPLSEQSILDNLVTFIFAGHDTSTSSICSAVYAYGAECSAEYKQRLREEVCQALPIDKTDTMDYETLNSLPLLDAFIREVLRRYGPIAGMVRTVRQPLEYDGYAFQSGDRWTLDYSVLMHNPEYFKDAMKFDPERFINDKIQPFTYVPFGGGVRMCLGMGLAKMELKCFMAHLVREYDVQVAQHENQVFPMYFVAPTVHVKPI